MPNTAKYSGLLLVVIGVAGYVYGLMNGAGSFTALIPAAFGVVLAVLGMLASSNEGLRKHLMHGAVIVALLGFIATAGRLFMKLSDLSLSAAVVSQILTAAVCLIFIILAIKSFAAARSSGND